MRPPRLAPHPVAVFMVFALAAGCGGPRPAQPFVAQARQLHTMALVSGVAGDADLREYVQLIGERLLEAARSAAPDKTGDPLFSHMHFDVVNVDVPNVFTTGGDHVYVYTGLIRICADEEELAAAMAHAVAHALNLDVQNLPMRPNPARLPPEVAWQFVVHRFTAQQEWSADKLAFAIYARAGYDPDRFGNLFQRLSDMPAYNTPAAVDRAPLAIRPEAARVSGVEPQRRWRRAPIADRRTFAELRQTSASLAAESPKGMAAEVFLRAFPNCILPADTAEQSAAQDLLRPPPPPKTPTEPN